MQEATALHSVFAANRSAGRIALTVAAEAGVTRRRQVYEDGPLRIRFPNSAPPRLEAMIVNTAGGIAGGDRHDLDIGVMDGAALTVTSWYAPAALPRASTTTPSLMDFKFICTALW